MPPSRSGFFAPIRRFFRTPFGYAALTALIFYGMLYPTGESTADGFGYYIIGWLLPDLFNLFLSYAIAKKLSNGVFWKTAVILPVCAVSLCILPSAPQVFAMLTTKTPTQSQIYRPVVVTKDYLSTYVSSENDELSSAFSGPLQPRVRLGSDEGCMCSYFAKNYDDTYFYHMANAVGTHVGRSGYSRGWVKDAPVEHYEVSFIKAPSGNYDFRFDVVNRGEVTASFVQKNLPEHLVSNERYVRDLKYEPPTARRSDGFWRRATEILLKNTFLTKVLVRHLKLSYFPDAEFKAFLNQALIKQDAARP